MGLFKICCGWCEVLHDTETMVEAGEFGLICQECDDTRDNKSGYCSMNCQLSGNCDGSC